MTEFISVAMAGSEVAEKVGNGADLPGISVGQSHSIISYLCPLCNVQLIQMALEKKDRRMVRETEQTIFGYKWGGLG